MIRISVQIWLYCMGKMKFFTVFLHVSNTIISKNERIVIVISNCVSVNWTGSLLLSYNTHGQVWVYAYIVVLEEGEGGDCKCVTGHDQFLARNFVKGKSDWRCCFGCTSYTPPTQCLSFVKCEGLQGGPAQQHQQSQSCLTQVCVWGYREATYQLEETTKSLIRTATFDKR